MQLIAPGELLTSILAAVGVLIFSRLVLAFQNAWNAKKCTKAVLKVALWSEFNRKTLQLDLITAVIVAVISVLINSNTGILSSKVTLMGIIHLASLFRKRQSNPAIGLAWSYYFGYLKKVLPKLREKINESRCRDHMIDKLLVLIPADCYIYHELNKADDRLQFAENLQAVNESVAGIQNRKYTHSCYRIDAEGETLYAPLEYATPLNTLLEMSKHKKAGLSEEERHRQVLLFYETIQNIILNYSDDDHPDIKRRVEFVFLRRKANVVDEILRKLRETMQ